MGAGWIGTGTDRAKARQNPKQKKKNKKLVQKYSTHPTPPT
jgi:hypothetical protein